jgi:hypothetical protein
MEGIKCRICGELFEILRIIGFWMDRNTFASLRVAGICQDPFQECVSHTGLTRRTQFVPVFCKYQSCIVDDQYSIACDLIQGLHTSFHTCW